MSTIYRIRCSFANQALLRRVGPLVSAAWGISPANGSASRTTYSSGLIHGNVLVDTGADHIAIDESVAQQLGLQALPKRQEMYGLGGKQSAPVFNATLHLSVEVVRPTPKVPAGSSCMIGIPIEVYGAAGLHDGFESRGVKAPNKLPVIGILGRIFLQFTRFTYDGLSGNLAIEIDETVQYPKTD